MIKQKNKRGFSLMELLAVMAIMGILSTMAVTGYFSAVRGMKRRRAVSNVVAALNQARQRASIDGTRTAFICYNVLHSSNATVDDPKTFSPNYVVCKALGRMTCINPLGDEFTPLDKVFGTASSGYSFKRRLYNLSSMGWCEVQDTVMLGAYSTPLKSSLSDSPEGFPTSEMLWCFQNPKGSASWKVGDLYGIEVSPPEILPKTIYFNKLGADDTSQISVLFDVDGCPKNESGGDTTVTITLMEQKAMFATITVNSDGTVTYKQEGDSK